MPDEVEVLGPGGRMLVVRINRPAARNAVAEALDRLDADHSLSVGIVTGVGAGTDLEAFVRDGHPVFPGHGFAGTAVRSSSQPVIAAFEGCALAGGFEVVLARETADPVATSRDAREGATAFAENGAAIWIGQ